MTEEEYKEYEPPNYTDLVIVIYNKNVGRDELHAKSIGGFFQARDIHSKDALRIVVCECPSFVYGDNVWVVSHELAHFALFYLGYPPSVWVDWVHNTQGQYYAYCPEGDTTDSRCDGLWQKYEGYSRNYKVMKVYPGAYEKDPPVAKFGNYIEPETTTEPKPEPEPKAEPKPEPEPTVSVGTKVDSSVASQDDDLSELIDENRKLREELELIDENRKLREELGRQGEQIDELNQEVDFIKQIIQSIQGFFSSIFG